MRHHFSAFTWSRMASLVVIAAAAIVPIGIVNNARGQVDYNTVGASYIQNFDTLPNTPTNTSLGNSPVGWTDDNASPGAGNFSIVGVYVYHPTAATEGGFNGHQRMRIANGNQTTGTFYSFAQQAPRSGALGDIGANTLAVDDSGSLFTALKIRNNTGQALNRFTLSYNGEQWRDGGVNTNTESLLFAYSTSATNSTWFASTGFTAASALNFTAPLNGSAAATVDGNVAGRVNNINSTVTNFLWAPGADIWLRWADLQRGGTDDGLAIDDINFSADAGGTGPPLVTSLHSGPAEIGTTWSDGLAPSAGKIYYVQPAHVVDVSATFAGDELKATNGGTINLSASGVYFPYMSVDAGGNVTESVSGDFVLGDSSQLTFGTFNTIQNLFFNIDAGSSFALAVHLIGSGDLTFNSGDASTLILADVGSHSGTIHFNGTGDEVQLVGSTTIDKIEMNSSGQNKLVLNSGVNTSNAGTVTFSKPGIIDHVINTGSGRLQGPNILIANAHVTVNMLTAFTGTTPNERRFNILGGLQGTGDIDVNGVVSASDPTSGSVTHNEFELGTTPEQVNTPTDNYSGTITSHDWVDFEIRRNIPGAKIVISNQGRLETGPEHIPTTRQVNIGEVQIKSGGTLEVGFEEDGNHDAGILNLVNTNGRSGGLTMEAGSNMVMQINGTAATLFDSLTAQGNVSLHGTLHVLMNATGIPGTDQAGSTQYATFNPVGGETFDIITTIGGTSPAGDYDHNFTVNAADYDAWRNSFGTTVTAGTGADGNGDGVIDAADFVLWRENVGATGSAPTISGTFDSLDVQNMPAGFAIQVDYSNNSRVRLTIVAAGLRRSRARAVDACSHRCVWPLFGTRRKTRRGGSSASK